MKEITQNINTEKQNYFRLYLTEYLHNNGFKIDDEVALLVDTYAEEAAENYNEEISFGNTPVGAMEVAMKSLFSNVGISEMAIISDVLEENFSDLHSLDTSDEIEQTTQAYIALIPDLFDGIESVDIGLSPEGIDTTKTILTGRITEYIEQNGI